MILAQSMVSYVNDRDLEIVKSVFCKIKSDLHDIPLLLYAILCYFLRGQVDVSNPLYKRL